MTLTLVLGPANSAKAGEVLGAFAAAARRGALLVVPTALDVGHYAGELAGDGVVLGSVLTFGGLVAEIGRRAEYAGRRLTELQRGRVLERVLAGLSLDALRSSAQAGGFADAAAALIAELQAGRLSRPSASPWRCAPGRRRTSGGRPMPGTSAACTGSTSGSSTVWAASTASCTPGGRSTRCAPRRGAGRRPGLLLWLRRPHRARARRVETLARVVGVEVTVSLTYEPGRDAFARPGRAVEALRPMAARVLELPAQDEHYAAGSRAVLHHLERSLFTGVEPGSSPEA